MYQSGEVANPACGQLNREKEHFPIPSPSPPVDRRRLVTDFHLRQEVVTVVGRHLRTNPPGGSNMNDVAAAFAAAVRQTAELVIPPQERRRPGRDWSGDAQTEADLQASTDAIHAT